MTPSSSTAIGTYNLPLLKIIHSNLRHNLELFRKVNMKKYLDNYSIPGMLFMLQNGCTSLQTLGTSTTHGTKMMQLFRA